MLPTARFTSDMHPPSRIPGCSLYTTADPTAVWIHQKRTRLITLNVPVFLLVHMHSNPPFLFLLSCPSVASSVCCTCIECGVCREVGMCEYIFITGNFHCAFVCNVCSHEADYFIITVCVFVCVCVCTCVHVCTHVCVCMHVLGCVYVIVCVCVVRVCVYVVCVFVCVCVCAHLCVSMQECMYICVNASACACTHNCACLQ